MADSTVLNDLRWPLPAHPEAARALLIRWTEPHRRYHDLRHLRECVTAARLLSAGDDAVSALWFHDAVHTNTPGRDEAASAAFAQQLLAPLLPQNRVDEIVRLVLLTEHHQPAVDDRAGATVCDADLWILGASPQRYHESLRDLRAERGLTGSAWRSVRGPQIEARLGSPIFHTPQGRAREAAARANLSAELQQLGG